MSNILSKEYKAMIVEFGGNPLYFRETQDNERLLQVVDGILHLPPMKWLRYHLNKLDSVIERIRGHIAIQANKSTLVNYTNWDEQGTDLHDDASIMEYLAKLETMDVKARHNVVIDIETAHLGLFDNSVLAMGFYEEVHGAVSLRNLNMKVVEKLQCIFDRNDFNFILHNGKFDTKILKSTLGLDLTVDDDTMLMHYAFVNEKKGTHSLKYLAQLYLGAPAWEDELKEYHKGWCRSRKVRMKDFTYDMIPTEMLIPYLHKDLIATFRLYNLFNTMRRPEAEFIYSTLVRASNTFKEIELRGFYTDKNYVAGLESLLEVKIDNLMEEIQQVADKYWDPTLYVEHTGAKKIPSKASCSSPKQLVWLLGRMGFATASSSEPVLQMLKIQAQGETKDFLDKLLQFRKLSKQLKTYVIGLQDEIGPDSRVHCTFNLHGTETGRLSSSGPNIHNIPRDKSIKNIFRASEGKILVQLDYSQAELRVLAHLSGDPWLTKVYEDGLDLHDAVSLKMFGPDFTKDQRVLAKTINFGIAYGRGASSIAEVFDMSVKDAQKMIDDWFKPMPVLKQWILAKRRAPLRGEACTTPFGRRRHFVITDDNIYHVQNEAINFPIQSVASDLTLLSLLELHDQLKERDLGHIVNTVHDSIIIETTNDNAQAVVDLGVSILRNTPIKLLNSKVPFNADAEIGPLWGELEAVDSE